MGSFLETNNDNYQSHDLRPSYLAHCIPKRSGSIYHLMGYNSSKESGTETKFGTQNELNALNNLKYNYLFSVSRDMSRVHYSTNHKSTNSIHTKINV